MIQIFLKNSAFFLTVHCSGDCSMQVYRLIHPCQHLRCHTPAIMPLKILTSIRMKKLASISGLNQYSTKTESIMKLSERGMYKDIFPGNSATEVDNLLKSSSQCVYAGFDPTADSLHVGNLLVLVNLLHWQRAGHQVIALVGGATGLIGDPSERSKDRPMLEPALAFKNVDGIQKNVEKIFQNYENLFCKNLSLKPVKIVNNYDWYQKMNSVEFVGYVGRHFRMGDLLSRDSVSQRIKSEHGMCFTEFSYQIFQAFDWLHLLRKYNCRFQIGGSDQMGNIVSGHYLISRVEKKPVYGITLPLVKSTSGDKFGKSAGNAVWLSENKTSAFDLYQYFLRTPDASVEEFLKLFTFDSLGMIKELMHQHNLDPGKYRAQKHLAEQVTRLVHGEEGLEMGKLTTAVLYGKDLDTLSNLSASDAFKIFQGAPHSKLHLKSGMTCMNLAMELKCFKTESDAERIISAGGFYINFEKVLNPFEVITLSAHILTNNISIVRVGKHHYYFVEWM